MRRSTILGRHAGNSRRHSGCQAELGRVERLLGSWCLTIRCVVAASRLAAAVAAAAMIS